MNRDELTPIERLLRVMAALRAPDSGCAWDRKQTYQSILPYTLEEVYEVAEAIESQDFDSLKSELGDLLFQIVFYCQIAQEEGRFDFSQIAQSMVEKLVRRHPHVFADVVFDDELGLKRQWELTKAQERAAKNGADVSILADIPKVLPALLAAKKIQKRVSAYGFDWASLEPVIAKIHEELDEINQAIAEQESKQRIEEEIGDLLFACVNLSRHLKVDAEVALKKANQKFIRRFQFIESQLAAQNISLQQATLDEMDALWEQAKQQE